MEINFENFLVWVRVRVIIVYEITLDCVNPRSFILIKELPARVDRIGSIAWVVSRWLGK